MGYKDNIMGIVVDDKLHVYAHRKVAILRKGGDCSLECPCGKTVDFSAPKSTLDTLVAIFHDNDCYLKNKYMYIPKLKIELSPKRVPSFKKEPCPDCGGKAKKRGYKHFKDCPSMPKKAEVVTCDECGGPRRGRGYIHKSSCSAKISKQKVDVVTCDECGGPRRGKGYTHTEDCSQNSKRQKTGTTNTSATCPSCGGPRKGRGYTHTENCK